MDQRRWYPLVLRGSGKKKSSKRKEKGKGRTDDTTSTIGDDDRMDEEEEEAEGNKKSRRKARALAAGGLVEEVEQEEEYSWSDEEAREEGHSAGVAGEEAEGAEETGGTQLAVAEKAGTCGRQEEEPEPVESKHGEAEEGSDGNENAGQVSSEEAAAGVGGEDDTKEEEVTDLKSLLPRNLILPMKKEEEDGEEAQEARLQKEEGLDDAKREEMEEGVKIPRKRINSHLAVRGSELLVYGGKVDADKVEVTLDDIWTLDLGAARLGAMLAAHALSLSGTEPSLWKIGSSLGPESSTRCVDRGLDHPS